jgi:uncharacterized protein YciI
VDWQFFVAVSEYLVPHEVVLDNLAEHRCWSKAGFDAGLLLVAGRQDPPVGGVLAFRALDREAAETFLASDPFVRNGVARYHLTRFAPNPLPWRSEAFEAFATG